MRKGFTLVELVIVIVILGILAAVAIPKFVDITANAKEAAARGAVGGLRSGIAIWYASNAATSSGSTAWPSLANLTDPANAKAVMAQGVPPNPYVTGTGSTVVKDTTADYTGSDTTNGAWVYNTANGKIWASNNTAY